MTDFNTTGCRPPTDAAAGSRHILTGGGVSDEWWWSGTAWHVRQNNPFNTSPTRMAVLGWSYLRPVKEVTDVI